MLVLERACLSAAERTGGTNSLLALLSEADYSAILPHLEPVRLLKGIILAEPHIAPDYAYFPLSGIASVLVTSPEGQHAEAGLIGRDGFVNLGTVVGASSSPFRVNVQIAGEGFRVATPVLASLIRQSHRLQELLLRFYHCFTAQMAFTALSNAVHQIDERLARWLLMCHDRMDGNEIAVTHEFMAVMLAVRRPSVTSALHVLEGNGFIRSERGQVTIRNRKALEEFARDAYGSPEREYRRLIGPIRPTH